ncbi:MAG: amino acid permease [Streptococcaceae bacterium]|nr:amino acid permease [Streptococcaceae bacterium]
MELFRKKSSVDQPLESKLTRNLTTPDLVFLGVGAIVGTGIFTVTGVGANQWAGPALSLSFLIAAISVALSGLIFAEYSSRVPAIGGPYAFLFHTFGEFFGWIGGWLIILEFILAGSSAATGWSGYVRGFVEAIGIHIPKALSGAYNSANGTFVDLLAMLVTLTVTIIITRDAKKFLRFNSAMVLIKLFLIVLFILFGAFFINKANWQPFMPFGFFGEGHNTGVVAGSALMFFAYLGFESISMAVEETKNPKKSIPRGILYSIGISTVLYILVTIVLTGMVNYKKLGVNDPVAFAMRSVHQPLLANIITAGAVVTLLTVLVSMIYGLSRLVYAIAKDGLLPKFLTKVNDTHHNPQNATIVIGVIALIFSGFIPLQTLAQVVNILTLTYLILMAIGLIFIRKNETKAPVGTFVSPFYPVLPILSILVSGYLMLQLSLDTWIIFGILLLIGVIIYFAYGYKHSILNEESEKS